MDSGKNLESRISVPNGKGFRGLLRKTALITALTLAPLGMQRSYAHELERGDCFVSNNCVENYDCPDGWECVTDKNDEGKCFNDDCNYCDLNSALNNKVDTSEVETCINKACFIHNNCYDSRDVMCEWSNESLECDLDLNNACYGYPVDGEKCLVGDSNSERVCSAVNGLSIFSAINYQCADPCGLWMTCKSTPTPTETATVIETATPTPTATQHHSYPTSTPTAIPTNVPAGTPTHHHHYPTSTPTETYAVPTRTPTLNPTNTPVKTATNVPTRTPTHHHHYPTSTPTRTPTRTPMPCYGDCDNNGCVKVNELITAVKISLYDLSTNSCKNADVNRDSRVTIDELIVGVNNALYGCKD